MRMRDGKFDKRTLAAFGLSALLLAAPGAASAQVALYDPAGGWLTIPSVSVGGAIYTGVTLKDSGGLRFVLQSATAELPAATPPLATYDAATRVLSIPLVNAGATQFSAVTLRDEGNFTFSVLGGTASAAPPRVQAPPRWLEAWTSTDASTRAGTYTLSVVDPAAPGSLLPIDSAVPVADFGSRVARIRGGTFDPASGLVSDPGVRHLVINRGGRIFRVTYDKLGAAAPVPVQLSSETAAQDAPALLARSASGEEALLRINLRTGSRYVRLNTAATAPLLQAPTFPGDTFTSRLVGYGLHPDTGAIDTLLWESLTGAGTHRLFRTDAAFGSPTSIAVHTDAIGAFGIDPSFRGARGWFYKADGALRRYDFASRSVAVVQERFIAFGDNALHDDHALLLRATVDGTARVLRCVDAATARCVTLVSGPVAAGSAGSALQQTRDHVLIVPVSGTTFTSVRKSDGAVFTVAPPAGVLSVWVPGSGQSSGDRLLFWRMAGTRNLVGSLRADGSDVREYDGTPISSAFTLPRDVAAHRLGHLDFSVPIDRLLVRAGVAGNPNTNGTDRLAWLSTETGELSAELGTVPSRFFGSLFLFSSGTPYPLVMGAQGTIGLSADVSQRGTGVTTRPLDAFLLGTQPPSLSRLSTLVP